MNDPSIASLLTESWLDASGDDLASRAVRRSLEASAQGDPELMKVLINLKAPTQAELDVHIAGEGVRGHETAALPFGKFVQRTAEAVKELAKGISGSLRMPADLQILAPSPGSVRVVFRAPQAPVAGDIPSHEPASSNSMALRQFVDVLDAAANDDSGDSATLAAVSQLPARAQVAVARTAKVIRDGHWELHGVLRQRGQPPRSIEVPTSAADRIVRSVGPEVMESAQIVRTGSIDGVRKSTLVMWFIPDSGRAFAAAVPGEDLMNEVSSIAADAEARVRASFVLHTYFGLASGGRPRQRYELVGIERIGARERPTSPFDGIL